MNKKRKSLKRQPAKPVYRFFDEEWQAEDFSNGKIFISTINKCRGYEDALRGDKGEAIKSYTISNAFGASSDPHIQHMSNNAGVGVGNFKRVSLSNITRIERLPDAYVLCTTVGFSDQELGKTFGAYCVKITNVQSFFNALTKRINSQVCRVRGMHGPIIYRERHYEDLESYPYEIGFVKPPDKYKDQKEYRFLWHAPVGREIAGVVVNCPEAIGYVKRIA
ncbi:hypothetical protein [Pseudomonas glycinae]|uniref:hypothetical protein n=1 Tax=Pseudomonas glycinae TaxID=1785145 RepID=UPI002B1D996B|nr:hypothetical protein [Pseudomonas glycinae]